MITCFVRYHIDSTKRIFKQTASPVAALVTALVNLPEHAVATAITWQQRVNERQHLRDLDDRMLSDMGLSRADVDKEVAKPFWIP